MGLWAWLVELDERVGIRPRRGPFDCEWCRRGEHPHCTGVAVRPRIPAHGGAVGRFRQMAETERCACDLSGHAPRP